MDWDSYFGAWCATSGAKRHQEAQRLIVQARTLLARTSRTQDGWVWDAAADPERRWFLAKVLAANVSRRLLPAMVRAAVYTLDASMPGFFIAPSIRCFGQPPIWQLLLAHLEFGTLLERMGASYCLYSAGIAWLSEPPMQEGLELLARDSRGNVVRTPVSLKAQEAIAHAHDRMPWKAQEFVTNDDRLVRRNLAGTFALDPSR